MVDKKIELDGKEEKIATDKENYFSVVYYENIDEYFLSPIVAGVAWYNRYYRISKDDVELYNNNKDDFYKKFETIIKQQNGNLYNLCGSQSTNDYCIMSNNALAQSGKPEWKSFDRVWWKGYMWLKVLWNNKYYLVLPNTEISEEFAKETGVANIPSKDFGVLYGVEYDEKNNVLDVIMSNLTNKNDYVELLSACIGKVYSNQIELQEYLGNYQKWNVDISKGELYIDDKKFDVDFLGTTSNSDGMWFNADLEKQIPERYLQALFSSYKNIEKYGLYRLEQVKLNDLYTDHSLAIIYTALSGKNTCYFKGSGDVSIFMIFNNIPEDIVKPIDANKFANRTMYIIQNFNVKHRLMIKSFAISNGNEFVEENDSIIVKFTNDSSLIFKFDDKDRLINISGNL